MHDKSKNNIRVALLEDGQMVKYDGCSSEYSIDFTERNMDGRLLVKA